jgi:hypothetical protein
LTYAFIHRDVIEVRELEPYIEDLTGKQKVRGVTAADFDDAGRDRLIVIGIEIVLLPLLLSATRRVIEVDRERRLPTATDAYKRGLAPFRPGPLPEAKNLGALLVSVAFALFVGFAAYQAGRLLTEAFPDAVAFGILGTAEAVARSLALPWPLVTWVEGAPRRARSRETELV